MISEEKVQVLKIIEKTKDAIWLETSGGARKAVLYRRLHKDIKVGDWMIVNTTATELALGTGGWDIVRAILSNQEKKIKMKKSEGHIMKGRYLSDQHSVLSIEAPESPYHSIFKKNFSLKGKNIFLCELHSMLPIVWFLLQYGKKSVPLTVIFSDEASLPLGMSRHLAYLKEQEQFLSITAGQSFGGQHEAVNIVTALQFAIKYRGDGFILITQGPGVTGSNTHYGFTSLAQANWANMIGALGGLPVWIPRLSESDQRTRHQGISHHTMTPLSELTLTKSLVPLPVGTYSDLWLKADLHQLMTCEHVIIKKIDEKQLLPLLDKVQSSSPFPITSMGRTIDKDPLFFLGVAAAVQWYFDEFVQSFNV